MQKKLVEIYATVFLTLELVEKRHFSEWSAIGRPTEHLKDCAVQYLEKATRYINKLGVQDVCRFLIYKF